MIRTKKKFHCHTTQIYHTWFTYWCWRVHVCINPCHHNYFSFMVLWLDDPQKISHKWFSAGQSRHICVHTCLYDYCRMKIVIILQLKAIIYQIGILTARCLTLIEIYTTAKILLNVYRQFVSTNQMTSKTSVILYLMVSSQHWFHHINDIKKIFQYYL